MAGANTAFDLSAASAQTIGGLSGTGNVTLGASALTLAGSASAPTAASSPAPAR